MEIEFFMPMVPPTAQMRKVTRTGRMYDPPEVKAMKAKLEAHLAQHRPERPMDGAVCLVVLWKWPTTKNHKDGELKITRPDTDNLQKALKDCMTKLGYWWDDAQVAVETVAKSYNTVPGIGISIEEVGRP